MSCERYLRIDKFLDDGRRVFAVVRARDLIGSQHAILPALRLRAQLTRDRRGMRGKGVAPTLREEGTLVGPAR